MNRRGFLGGLGSLLAAPAIVQFASLMPVRGIIMDAGIPDGYMVCSAEFAALLREYIENNAEEVVASIKENNALFGLREVRLQ